MNKKIKDLMIESGAYDHYEINEGVNGDELPMVKFAELIVRECAEFTHPVTRKFIMEHFGVEESKGWICSKCGTDRTKQECPNGYTAALTGECPIIGEAH